MEKKKSSFSGQIGFVLAAKDSGGLFLLVYLVLVLRSVLRC